jgi:lysylphosphatidylglycerol synthetase-like protein (DUF2156 family)
MYRFAPLLVFLLMGVAYFEPVAIFGSEFGVNVKGQEGYFPTAAAWLRIIPNVMLLILLHLATEGEPERYEAGVDISPVPNAAMVIYALGGLVILAAVDGLALLGLIGGIFSMVVRVGMALYLVRFVDWTMSLAGLNYIWDAIRSSRPFKGKGKSLE